MAVRSLERTIAWSQPQEVFVSSEQHRDFATDVRALGCLVGVEELVLALQQDLRGTTPRSEASAWVETVLNHLPKIETT